VVERLLEANVEKLIGYGHANNKVFVTLPYSMGKIHNPSLLHL